MTSTERLDEDGVAVAHDRFLIDCVERAVSRGGRQAWHALHPRGWRYLELLVGGDLGGFELHDFGATNAVFPAETAGSFECDDERLNAIWHLCPPTVRACMEDGFLDCPWRERGVYAGDLLVEMHAALATHGPATLPLARRSIELFLEGQGKSGLIAGGAHGLPPGRHPDYSAITAIAAAEYVGLTGDETFVEQHADRLRRLLDGLLDLPRHPSGAIDGGDGTFIDQARTTRTGPTCAFNSFVVGALRTCGKLLQDDAFVARGDELADVVRRRFWDDSAEMFRDLPGDGDSPATVHGNATAILYDVADPAKVPGAAAGVADLLARNFEGVDAIDSPRHTHHVNSYFAYYAIEALMKAGGHDAAVGAFVADAWGRMVDAGAWTAWEYFSDPPGASRCHAWSCAPAAFFHRHVLGVTRLGPDAVRVAPRPCGLSRAAGVVPHERGPIRVRWTLGDGGVPAVELDAPQGLRVDR